MKKTPKLRFPEFSAEWENKKIGSITKKVGSGKTPKGGKAVYTDEGVMFLRSQNVLDGKLSINDVGYISEDENRKMMSTEVYSNDILLNITGASIGRSCVVPTGFPSANVNQHVCIIRLNEKYESYFIMNQIISYKVQKQIDSYQAGGNREGLNFEQIKNIEVSVTSYKEQEKIASFFSLIDEKIQKQQKKVEALQDYKKGIMQKIFSQEIRFKNDNGKDFPEWQTKKLGELLSIPEKIKEENISKDKLLTVKLHRSGVQVNKNTDTLDIGSTIYYRRNSGQLIYGKQNFFNGAIDIIPEELDGFLSSGDVPSLNINNSEAEPNFLLNFIGRTEFYKRTESLASGTGSKRLHENILLDIDVYIPTLDEQRKISQYLILLNKKTLLEEKKLEVLNEWKKGLLQQMFV